MTEKNLPTGTLLLKRYKIQAVLGTGSFGITYLGWDTRLNGKVAIKEFCPRHHAMRSRVPGHANEITILDTTSQSTYQEMLQKYIDEARHLSNFRGLDGVVSVYDFFHENNTAYIVMEYIDGISLQTYVKEHGPIAGKEALELISPIINALITIHKTGLIHRDISPDNILVTKDKKLILIDFGSARAYDLESDKSLTVMFKRGFSPAEQYLAHGMQGMWSDIYSLCATIYFMLVGSAPTEALERIFEDNVTPLQDIDISLPKYQKRALMKGLSVNAEKRYRSMEELAAALFSKEHSHVSMKRFIFLPLGLGLGILLFLFIRKEEKVPPQNPPAATSLPPTTSAISKADEIQASVTLDATTSPDISRSKVPNVVGLSYQKAKTMLKKKHFSYTIRWKKNSKKKGLVIRQNKKAGTLLPKKSNIIITVSKGAPLPTATPTKAPERKATATQKPSDKKPGLDGMII